MLSNPLLEDMKLPTKRLLRGPLFLFEVTVTTDEICSCCSYSTIIDYLRLCNTGFVI